jgi:hypothetical protein
MKESSPVAFHAIASILSLCNLNVLGSAAGDRVGQPRKYLDK